MSQDLVQAYYERDLSPAELDALHALLDQDPSASNRFLALAEHEWRKSGRPEPLSPWQKRRKRLWVASSVAGALALGLAAWLLMPAQEPQAALNQTRLPRLIDGPALTMEQPRTRFSKPVETDLQIHTAQIQGRATLDLSISLKRKQPVQVWAEGFAGKTAIFSGSMKQGENKIRWTPPKVGHWKMVMQTKEARFERWVMVEETLINQNLRGPL
jgi:hypothetical protein